MVRRIATALNRRLELRAVPVKIRSVERGRGQPEPERSLDGKLGLLPRVRFTITQLKGLPEPFQDLWSHPR